MRHPPRPVLAGGSPRASCRLVLLGTSARCSPGQRREDLPSTSRGARLPRAHGLAPERGSRAVLLSDLVHPRLRASAFTPPPRTRPSPVRMPAPAHVQDSHAVPQPPPLHFKSTAVPLHTHPRSRPRRRLGPRASAACPRTFHARARHSPRTPPEDARATSTAPPRPVPALCASPLRSRRIPDRPLPFLHIHLVYGTARLLVALTSGPS